MLLVLKSVAMFKRVDKYDAKYYGDDDDNYIELDKIDIRVKKTLSPKGQFTAVHLSSIYRVLSIYYFYE
jgi:hypothetical protein